MAETRTAFPPHDLTEDEEAALVGRFNQDTEPQRDPAGHGRAGREKAAPRGVVYVRDQERERAASIRAAVAQFEAVGEEVPEHLAALAAELPEEEPEPEAEVEAEAEPEGETEAEEETAEPEEEGEEVDLEGWTVAELKDALEQAGVEYDPRARKADLIELLEQAEVE
jgi:hypothetical protein